MCETEKRVMLSVPKLYRKTALDLVMYGFISGMKKALPSMTIKDCILMFQKENDLSEDEFPLDSARVTYQRMQSESWANCKKENGSL